MSEQITNISLRGVIVLLGIFIIWITTSNSRNFFEMRKSHQKDLDSMSIKIDSLSNKVDSLGSEIFIYETQLNRYQIAIEMLENENPSAASEFNKRLSMTE